MKKQEKVFSLFLPLPLKCCRIKIKKNIVLTSVPLDFVVNTVLMQYCVYYENYWNSLSDKNIRLTSLEQLSVVEFRGE